ncbi:glycoside hydrolase family 97 catalytic domain-containing protein [Catenuloplanes japonicus]|uniref:glycoside hydrolase family 97 catalytic domain-containing protein n=1 Tax=Catenuloplanes japonicus TaxID=33876 RepID=UPI000AD83F63|nr:glycoside hydrolase family 97 catalytic domain-containing protein [Catenuloplanes japonicus]
MHALLTAVLVASLMPGAPAAAAAREWTVPAPGGGVTARVTLDEGRLAFGVDGVLPAAPIGLRTTTADLSAGLSFVSQSGRTVRERYTMTTGKRLVRDTTLRESTFAFTGAGGTRLDLVVRVSAEGAAYRYALPEPATVTGEVSSWTVPADADAWLLPYSPNYEEAWVQRTAGGAPAADYGFPALFRTGGSYVLLTESDVDGRYAGGRLRHAGGGAYTVALPETAIGAVGRTPWRVAIVGSLATVTGSTLVDDLAPPSKINDTSWVRPGVVAWSWLSEHASPADPVRQRQYIDFAARNSWPYVLIDEGWDTAWVPEIVRYARARGVDVILWLHWTTLDTPQERDTLLPRIKAWGVAGLKIDFMDSDSQARFRWYDEILPATAALKLMVNFHGATTPRGLQRTWPHVLTQEAVRGAEQFRTRAATNTIFPFTRNVAGGMDYTPVTWAVTDRDTTDAHEVALSVVYESGWQHLADRFETYETHPEALRTLNQIPTVWDESRLLSGAPGQSVTMARRAGDRWWVAGLSALPAGNSTAGLDFLGGGRWLAETLRDGDHGLVRESRIVRRGDTLTVPTAANGGFVTVVCPYTGAASCDRAIVPVPATVLTVSPATAEAQPGSTLEVAATFTLPAGGPITEVRLAPAAGGTAVTAARLRGGESVAGSWRLTVPTDALGAVDLPIVATYLWQGSTVHVEQAVRLFVPPPAPSGDAWVSDLPFLGESNGYGPVERDRSNGEQSGGDGNPLTLRGVVHPKGLGTHAASEVTVWLGGACTVFTAVAGIDDEVSTPGSAAFEVAGDGRVLAGTGVLRSSDPGFQVTADVTGIRRLTLRVTDGGDGKNFDHADWAAAHLSCTGPRSAQ